MNFDMICFWKKMEMEMNEKNPKRTIFRTMPRHSCSNNYPILTRLLQENAAHCTFLP